MTQQNFQHEKQMFWIYNDEKSQMGSKSLLSDGIELIQFPRAQNNHFRPADRPKNTVHYITVVEMYETLLLSAFTSTTSIFGGFCTWLIKSLIIQSNNIFVLYFSPVWTFAGVVLSKICRAVTFIIEQIENVCFFRELYKQTKNNVWQ